MAWALHRTEKEKPAAGKTDYWRDFWRSGWDSNPRNLAVQLISSQSRYDHFDTAPYLSQHQHLGKRGELMGRTSKNIKLRIPEKPHKIKGFRTGSYRVATAISSAARYNHFDTLPCINIRFLGLITWFRVSHLRPLGQLSVYLKCNPCSGRMQEKHARTIWNFEIRTRTKPCAADIFSRRNGRSFQKYHVDHITVDSTSINIIISYSDSVCNSFSR